MTGVHKTLKVGRWFRPGESACILPEKIAELLGVDPSRLEASRVRVFGESLPVIGLIDAGAFNELKDLDEEPLSPADFKLTDEEAIEQMTTQETREKQGLEQPEVEIMPFEHINPDDVLIVPYAFLRQVGSPLQSVARPIRRRIRRGGQCQGASVTPLGCTVRGASGRGRSGQRLHFSVRWATRRDAG